MAIPRLTLDNLASDWLPRSFTQLAALPGLTNDLGSLQIEADLTAIKHPVFPPFSAGGETTGLLLINGKSLTQCAPHVEVRWTAAAIYRRCDVDGWHLTSRTSLLPDEPGAIIEITIENRGAARDLSLGMLLSGRSRNTGAEGYAWAVPSVPTDVFSFTKTEGLAQTVTPASLPDALLIANEGATAHTVFAVWPAPARWRRERVPEWRLHLAPGARTTICLLCTFNASAAEAQRIATRWHRREAEAFAATRARWDALWQAAFTPGNPHFSGSLPVVDSPHDAVNRLYYMGVLTLLFCRRRYPHAILPTSYLTLCPRRGEGTVYLAWDLPYTSGMLARLDPAVLDASLRLLLTAPPLDYQHTNLFDGTHFGWPCCAQPQAIFTAAINLTRWTSGTAWQQAPITVRPKLTSIKASPTNAAPRPAIEFVRDALRIHRTHHLPDSPIVSFGDRGAYLECITTYAHGTAGHTALQAWALQEAAPLLGEDTTREVTALRAAAMQLFDPAAGHFVCRYPDGRTEPAANLYDIGLVLSSIGEYLPASTVDALLEFVRARLITRTWAHCLDPADLDALSGIRCDHQSAGCFPAWPAQFIRGVLRAGRSPEWLTQWINGIAEVTRQGPFAQAYWAEDMHPPEAGAAAKCYDELTQGNHWAISSGVFFAEMILDGICGLHADLAGHLTVRPGLQPWQKDTRITGIVTPTGTYNLENGVLVRASNQAGSST